jgi:MOSC domain-containing protein YiiM
MKLISLNVALPRLVEWNGGPVATGIFKEPVQGAVMLRTLNLDGDRQADLSVHGGVSKAVYAYPSEHYEFWKKELPDMELPFGMFGENFTTAGLLEDAVNVGDRFSVGEAELMVTEPRMPCYKLGIKFGSADIIRKFLQSRRTGFYFAVLKAKSKPETSSRCSAAMRMTSRSPTSPACMLLRKMTWRHCAAP